MNPPDSNASAEAPLSLRAAAFSVHILTALGAGVALIALLAAVREHWASMFAWLGVALAIDAIDGPLARHFDVGRVQARWSGDVLDLVVDFTTYVFVPAYAIAASGLLLPLASIVLPVGIVVASALYFADRDMKTDDNHFRGFPALWNAAAFYVFLLRLPPAWSSLLVAILLVLMFVPFRVLHPVRVKRLRVLNIALMIAWAALTVITLAKDFAVSPVVTLSLCAIGLYVLVADSIARLSGRVVA